MIVHMVQNNDGMMIAIFSTKRAAAKFINDVGCLRWNEKWTAVKVKLDHAEPWTLAGCQSYQLAEGRIRR